LIMKIDMKRPPQEQSDPEQAERPTWGLGIESTLRQVTPSPRLPEWLNLAFRFNRWAEAQMTDSSTESEVQLLHLWVPRVVLELVPHFGQEVTTQVTERLGASLGANPKANFAYISVTDKAEYNGLLIQQVQQITDHHFQTGYEPLYLLLDTTSSSRDTLHITKEMIKTAIESFITEDRRGLKIITIADEHAAEELATYEYHDSSLEYHK